MFESAYRESCHIDMLRREKRRNRKKDLRSIFQAPMKTELSVNEGEKKKAGR